MVITPGHVWRSPGTVKHAIAVRIYHMVNMLSHVCQSCTWEWSYRLRIDPAPHCALCILLCALIILYDALREAFEVIWRFVCFCPLEACEFLGPMSLVQSSLSNVSRDYITNITIFIFFHRLREVATGIGVLRRLDPLLGAHYPGVE